MTMARVLVLPILCVVIETAIHRADPRLEKKLVIHLLDWHHVGRETFTSDQAYRQHLDDVESIQAEQIGILRSLAGRHGVRTVYLEGLTVQGLPQWRERLAMLQGAEQELQRYRQMMADIDDDLAEFAEQADSDDFRSLAVARALLAKLAEETRIELLRIGAVGRLEIARELTALPLEDEQAHQASKPTLEGGELVIPSQAARESAMVRRLLDAPGPVVFVVLGGGHDLGKRLNSTARYVRVNCDAYKEAAGAREGR